jgi:spore coat protein U-like protein
VINSTTALDFGPQGVLTTNVDMDVPINVQCTTGTPYNIGLDAGIGSGATVAVRKMTAAGSTVNYTIYTDATHATVWGNTVGTDTVTGLGTGISIAHRIWGRVPAQTTPAPGVYNDTVTVTVTY